MLFNLNQLFTNPGAFFLSLLYIVLAVLVSITVHEWAHAFVAYKLGDPTAKNLGRMSLDPSKHIDPIGFLCFVLLGFGWAKPVMVSSRNLKHFRRDDIFISMAGPLMNLLVAFVFVGIYCVCFYNFYNEILNTILFYIYYYNIILALFNIIPVYPLDGFHVLSSICTGKSHKILDFFQRYGFYILLILIITRATSYYIDFVGGAILNVYFSFFGLFF